MAPKPSTLSPILTITFAVFCADSASLAHGGIGSQFQQPLATTVTESHGARDGVIKRPGARGARSTYDFRAQQIKHTIRDVTDVRVWPAPVSESHDANASFEFVGGPDVAATGPDCPYLSHGPATNLSVCEAACADDGSCNAINWNPTIPDCVFRSCVDPMHPQLSPAPGYSVYGTLKQSYDIDPSSFTLASIGYSDAVLMLGLARYAGIIFVYGPGNASAIANSSNPLLPGLRVNVTGGYSPLDQDTDESYHLVAPDPDPAAGGWATLTATSVYGALRGLETFSQLVQYNLTSDGYRMVYSEVDDYPRFPYRGVMVDTSRHYITVATMKLIMDQMSYLKLNVMHLHLSDDQSWPLQLDSYPLLAQMSAYSNYSHSYSHADVQDIVTYAGNRGIRVIPEFDSPSHFSSLFPAYPQYAAHSVDSNNNSYLCMVDISNEDTFEFLEGIWREMSALFPDSHLMIGGDEFWPGCWQQSANVSAWMAERNYTTTDAYYYYERRMIDIIRSLGRNTLAWLDISGFPLDFNSSYSDYPDVTLDVWSGCYSGNWQNDVSTLTSQNMSVIVSGPFYVTQQNGAPSTPHFTWQQMYGTDLWNFTGWNVTVGNGTSSNTTNTSVLQGALVYGGELCAWDDAAQTDSGDLWMSLTPYLIGVAEPWWSPQSMTSGVQPDEGRAHAHRCRMGARGIPSHPIYAFGTYCQFEYEPLLAQWDVDGDVYDGRARSRARARVVVLADGDAQTVNVAAAHVPT